MGANTATEVLNKLMVFYSALPVTHNEGQALTALSHAHDVYAFCNNLIAKEAAPIDIDAMLDMMQTFEALTRAIQIKFSSNFQTSPTLS
jgi:hypothetical protein